MIKYYKIFLRSSSLLLIVLLSFQTLKAQSDFAQVYNILQANCASSSCHGGATPLVFDVSGSMADVYANLIDIPATNPVALAKGNKLVDPGHPYNSYLLRKIGATFDDYMALDAPGEGVIMPKNASNLADKDIEMVRQWIMQGATFGGSDVDTALINEYYTVGGAHFLPAPPKPNPGEGIQVRLGPIFLAKGASGEVEYLKKHNLRLTQDISVTKLEGTMNNSSHHFLLFEYDSQGSAQSEDDGLRLVDLFQGVTAFDGDKIFSSAWQDNETFELPSGTAFFWDAGTWLDLNYHILNYYPDSILPADFYLNIYFNERGAVPEIPMRAQLENNPLLFLLPGANDRSLTRTYSGNDDRKIWMISSHTHKYGKDFDIYERLPNGNKGPQIYEGFFNEDYTFNQGFYDWEHPAIRIFDSLYQFSANDGLVFETEWYVTQATPVTFGLTSNDEMQLVTYLYVNASETPIGVDPDLENEIGLHINIYPNPVMEEATIGIQLSKPGNLKIELMDIMGRSMLISQEKSLLPGDYRFSFNAVDLRLNAGVYFINTTFNNKSFVEKIIVTH